MTSAPDTRTPDEATDAPATGRPVARTSRAAIRTFRPRRIWPALIVSALLAAIAVVIAVSVISTLVGHPVNAISPAAITDRLTAYRWDDVISRIAAVIVGVAGLVCLLLAVKPGRLRAVPMTSEYPGVALGLTRGGLSNTLAAAAGDVNGADHARVRARVRRITVTVRTPLRDPGTLNGQVHAAVQRRLDELQPARGPRIRVRVRRRNT